MTMTRYIIITGLFSLVLLAGCERIKKNEPTGIYLSRVIYHQNVDQIRHYYYNDQKLLSMREYEFNDNISERFNYYYEDAKVVRIDYYGLNSNEDFTLYPKEYVVYEYDNDKISKATMYPGKSTVVYEYDNSRVNKIVLSSNSYTLYYYDNKDNIVKAVVYKEGSEYWKFIYTYDSKKNPYYNVEPVHDNFGGVDFIRFKCPNNLTYETFINENNDTISESEFIYEYDSYNLPVRSYTIYTSKFNGYERDTTDTRIYEYEIF